MAARNIDTKNLVLSFGLEVFFQALSQKTGVVTDDIVLAGVVGCGASQGLDADLAFIDFMTLSAQFSFADVEQKAYEKG